MAKPLIRKKNRQGDLGRFAWHKFMQNKLAVGSCIILFIIIVISFVGPLFLDISYSDVDMSIAKQAPSPAHILGTDEYGRDVLIRLIYGGRVSISVAFAAVAIQLTIGVLLGAVAGYFGGWVDAVIMRITDIIMCFPFYIIAICLAAILGPGLRNSILIIGFLDWPGICRIVRAQILSIKENDYIMAAKSLGLTSGRIIQKHILPNVFSPILVSATLSIAGAIMAEASLSYLGLGVKIPQPSWGNMLSAAQSLQVLTNEWWRWLPPGLMIVIVILAVNYIGEGLQDATESKAGE